MSAPPVFDIGFQNRLRDLLVWRRDVRHFRREVLPEGMIEHLIELACLSPSVGLSEPWRFVIVEDPERRERVRANFTAANAEALAAAAPDRQALYARLKLAGLDAAPAHLAVFADSATGQGHGLGRRTMPQMLEYSVVTAVHTLWLAARAEGVGMGWVSILDPEEMAAILEVPPVWSFIGYFCIGYPSTEDCVPELERCGWECRAPRESFVLRR